MKNALTIAAARGLRGWATKKLIQNKPDMIIGTRESPYLLRWYIIPRNRFFNIYLHRFCRSDDDRALHDHPWWSASLIIMGHYNEVTETGQQRVTSGQLVFRSAEHRHRVELETVKATTLFITGPKIRDWGFWCKRGFVPWQEFTSEAPGTEGKAAEKRPNVSSVGRGCGEE